MISKRSDKAFGDGNDEDDDEELQIRFILALGIPSCTAKSFHLLKVNIKKNDENDDNSSDDNLSIIAMSGKYSFLHGSD